MSKIYDYDGIIIGGGIGGLVTACYLSKNGYKILLAEKNVRPGGYCSSFVSKGYLFDFCAHALSSLRKEGRLFKILNELDVLDDLKISRHDPSEIIITPKHNIKIHNSFKNTVLEFQNNFPKQKNQVEDFLNFINFSPNSEILKLRKLNFNNLIDKYLEDSELKLIFQVLMLQLIGLHPNKLSAVVATLLLKEFILDGGYYPKEGVQALPNILAKKIEDLGGKVILNSEVSKIIISEGSAKGVILKSGKKISSAFVVSACDIHQTMFKMVDKECVPTDYARAINSFEISTSGFLVYLGLDNFLKDTENLKSNLYIINSLNFDSLYNSYLKSQNQHFAIISSSARNNNKKLSLTLATNGIFHNEKFWNPNMRNIFADSLINQAEKFFPALSKHISFKGITSPYTMDRWTYNYQGAAYGWASTPEQFGNPDISQNTKIKDLYNAGHWSNQSSGITFAANCGHNTADLIIHKYKR